MVVEGKLVIKNISIDLKNTFECGQCFRWKAAGSGTYVSAISDMLVRVSSVKNSLYIFWQGNSIQSSDESIQTFFRIYFDEYTNYGQVLDKLCFNSEILTKAVNFSPGIRILRQDPWETLCSFIISQNNNIPRIKGIIEKLCINFGQYLANGVYSFPSAEILSCLSEEDILPIKCGFRAKYIIDAAKKVHNKEVNLEKIRFMTTDLARNELMKIRGVGPKVADCTLLYAYHKLDVVPKDVWVKRMISLFFKNDQNLTNVFGDYAGLAQIYLFNYMRKAPYSYWKI